MLIFLSCLASFSAAQEQHSENEIHASTQSEGMPGSEPKEIESAKEVVVVTGTFTPLPLGEIDRAVSALPLQTNPPYNHWVDAIQWDPSIDFRQRAPHDVQADISIRGSSFGETLIMVDGLRMDDAQTGHHDADLPLPTESLSRIEVLRGAGSTLYGSDAMGGAVNFITANGERPEIRVGAGVGNFGINQQSLAASLHHDRWGEMLTMARDFSTGFARDRDYRSFTAFSASDVKTRLGRSMVMLGFGDKAYGADQFYGNFDSWERTKTWFAGLTQDLGARTSLNVGYRRHSDEFILLRDQPQVYENNHVSESYQLVLRHQQTVGKTLALFYGGEGNHDAIESNNLGNHSRSRGAVYFDADMRVLRRFSFSAGIREEIFDSHDTQFNPSIAAGMWLKAGWKVKASASRAFRLPTYTDLFYHDPGNAGNPNLKPESAWSYEGGVEWVNGGRWKIDLTGFQLREHDVIDYVQPQTGGIFQAENIQNLTFTGVEASAELRLSDPQRLTFAYTGLHGGQQALNGTVSRYVFNYPIHNGLVGWYGSLPAKVLVRTRVGITERFARDPYAGWDVDLGREFGRLGLRLSLANVIDSQYQEIQGVRMPGRSVIAGIEYVIMRKHD